MARNKPDILHLHTCFLFPFSIDKQTVLANWSDYRDTLMPRRRREGSTQTRCSLKRD